MVWKCSVDLLNNGSLGRRRGVGRLRLGVGERGRGLSGGLAQRGVLLNTFLMSTLRGSSMRNLGRCATSGLLGFLAERASGSLVTSLVGKLNNGIRAGASSRLFWWLEDFAWVGSVSVRDFLGRLCVENRVGSSGSVGGVSGCLGVAPSANGFLNLLTRVASTREVLRMNASGKCSTT